MRKLSDNEISKEISKEIITANVVFKDDSELIALIAVGLSDNECNDDEIFYYVNDTSELKSLLNKGNDSDFYIKSFSNSNGNLYWESN